MNTQVVFQIFQPDSEHVEYFLSFQSITIIMQSILHFMMCRFSVTFTCKIDVKNCTRTTILTCVLPMQDVPLISNIGTEFSIKPVNHFDHLASMDIVETDDFEACASDEGSSLFDYTYSATGQNLIGDKAGFKYSGPLSSSEAFNVTSSLTGHADIQDGAGTSRGSQGKSMPG